MKTDSLFYRIFKFDPGSLFWLVQPDIKGNCSFESITTKSAEKRFDECLKPLDGKDPTAILNQTYRAFRVNRYNHGAEYFRRGCQARILFLQPRFFQSNLGLLKREVDTFFDNSGYTVEFQCFAHQIDFDKRIQQAQAEYFFIPEWYIEKYGAVLGKRPLIIVPLFVIVIVIVIWFGIKMKSKITITNMTNRSI